MSADLPLHVLRSGAGERIIFLHGSGDTGAAAFAAQQPLAEDFELWMVDRRGFGQSAGAGRVDWAQDARDLLRLLDEPTHLVGHSYGTIACLLAAAEAPA